jgi:hypothetical protein
MGLLRTFECCDVNEPSEPTDPMLDAIADNLGDGVMPLSYLWVATAIDADTGERTLRWSTDPEMAAWERLGLVEFLRSVWQSDLNAYGVEALFVSEDDDE